MAGLINELIEVLDEQSALYTELIAFSKEKKKFIIINDTDNLKNITNSENIVAGRAQRMDKKRIALVRDICEVLNEKESNITLSILAEIIKDQPEYDKFNQAILRIKAALDELKQLNDQNKILIQSSLDFIDYNINVIRSTFDNDPIGYSPSGLEIVKGKSFFDAKN